MMIMMYFTLLLWLYNLYHNNEEENELEKERAKRTSIFRILYNDT